MPLRSFAVLVDNFNDNQSLLTAVVGAVGPAVLPLTTPLNSDFSTRSFELNVLTNTAGNNVELRAAAGILNINKGTDSTATLDTVWTAAAPIDFTAAGHDRLNFTLVENDLPVTLKIRATDNLGVTGYYTFGGLPLVIAGAPQTGSVFWGAVIWTANEDGTGGAVVPDFTQIMALEFIVDSTAFPNGSDTQIDLVETSGPVPPPGPPKPVPTLSQWGVIVFFMLIVAFAFREKSRLGS